MGLIYYGIIEIPEEKILVCIEIGKYIETLSRLNVDKLWNILEEFWEDGGTDRELPFCSPHNLRKLLLAEEFLDEITFNTQSLRELGVRLLGLEIKNEIEIDEEYGGWRRIYLGVK